MLKRMVAIIEVAEKHGTRWYLENCKDSALWKASPIVRLSKRKRVTLTQFDYCQYGTEYMKPTKIMCWNNPHFGEEAKTCNFGHHNQWRFIRSGVRHVVLKGKNVDGSWKTTATQAYPDQIADHLAKMITRAYIEDSESESIEGADDKFEAAMHNEKFANVAMNHQKEFLCVPIADGGDQIPASHYLTHFPKHPNCKICREQKCRGKGTGRSRKMRKLTRTRIRSKRLRPLVTSSLLIM
jgi:hypothetical protein